MKSVLIRLEGEAFRQLAAKARSEDRGIDQQATHFIRQALGASAATGQGSTAEATYGDDDRS